MDKYIVAVYVPTPADSVRELMELKDELTKVYGIRIIRTMKRGTPTLETEKGVIQFYSGTQVRRYALFGKKILKVVRLSDRMPFIHGWSRNGSY